MMILSTILLVAAFVLFLITALNVPNEKPINLTAAGLACWVLSLLVLTKF
jgi:hypothetical protein